MLYEAVLEQLEWCIFLRVLEQWLDLQHPRALRWSHFRALKKLNVVWTGHVTYAFDLLSSFQDVSTTTTSQQQKNSISMAFPIFHPLWNAVPSSLCNRETRNSRLRGCHGPRGASYQRFQDVTNTASGLLIFGGSMVIFVQFWIMCHHILWDS